MGDEALVELALADPQRGFAAIYDQYGARLYAYCHRLLRSSADAADAVQESFLTALAKIGQLREPGKLRSWLYAIARNHCMRRFRDRTRETADDEIGDELPAADLEGVAPGDGGVSRELVELVWAATQGLSDVDRQVLDLNIRHELDGEDLALSLGVEPSKCYVMLHRAKDRLQGAIGALLVARTGTSACRELADVLAKNNGGEPFTPIVRKRVNRHVGSCETCTVTQRNHRPEAYLAVVPLLRPPPGLSEKVIGTIQTAASAGPAASGAAAATHLAAQTPTPTQQDPGWHWRDDGFPLEPAVRSGRRAALLAGAALALLIGAIALVPLLNRFGSGSAEVAATTAALESQAAAAPVFRPTPEPDEGASLPLTVATTPPVPDVTPTPDSATPTPDPTTTPVPTATTPASAPPPAAPPESTPTAVATPTPEPTVTATPVPTVTPPPTPTSLPTPTPTITPVPDINPPTTSALTITCNIDPIVVAITVADDRDLDPTVSLALTFNTNTTPRPLTRNTAGSDISGTLSLTYVATVTVAEAPGGIVARVQGTVSDDAGNTLLVDVSDSCGVVE